MTFFFPRGNRHRFFSFCFLCDMSRVAMSQTSPQEQHFFPSLCRISSASCASVFQLCIFIRLAFFFFSQADYPLALLSRFFFLLLILSCFLSAPCPQRRLRRCAVHMTYCVAFAASSPACSSRRPTLTSSPSSAPVGRRCSSALRGQRRRVRGTAQKVTCDMPRHHHLL